MNLTIPTLALAALALASLSACERVPREQAAVASRAPPTTVVASRAEPPPAKTNGDAAASALPRDAISDSVISTRIKAGLLSDPGMAETDVSVNTDRGVVSLTGIIKSQDQAAIASAHAQRQDGVMRVDNQLAVNLR